MTGTGGVRIEYAQMKEVAAKNDPGDYYGIKFPYTKDCFVAKISAESRQQILDNMQSAWIAWDGLARTLTATYIFTFLGLKGMFRWFSDSNDVSSTKFILTLGPLQ